MRVPVAAFEVCSTSFLDADGKPLGELPDFASDRDPMVGMYRMMVLTRTYDAKAVALQRTGRIGCLLYTSPSPRDRTRSRMPSSA